MRLTEEARKADPRDRFSKKISPTEIQNALLFYTMQSSLD